jgi:glycolate oxidase iron-sulfur subunit
MKILGGLLKIYQLSKLDLLIRKTGLLHLLPQHLREMEAILPAASAKGVVEKTGSFHPAQGERIGSVALFRGCLMDVLFTETNMNTVKLLNLSGFDVVIPETQACCGALHAHSGEAALAKELAKKNIKVFKQYQVDYIVSNAGGCGALLIEYDHLLQNEPDWQEDAKWFASRTIDISQLLYRHGRIEALRENFSNEQSDRLEEKNAKLGQASTSITITYQDSCHLRNGMRSSEAPQQLLKYTSGVHFVELYEADRCCGSAGIYNITQPEMAGQIIEQKMQHVNKTNAHYLVTSNPGCLLQMKHGIAKHGVDKQMEAVHIVDFLYNRITNQ